MRALVAATGRVAASSRAFSTAHALSMSAVNASEEGARRRRLLLSAAKRERNLEQAISNIIYSNSERKEILDDDPEGQILSVLVEDEPGVLSRTASLLSGRGYNIKSLSV